MTEANAGLRTIGPWKKSETLGHGCSPFSKAAKRGDKEGRRAPSRKLRNLFSDVHLRSGTIEAIALCASADGSWKGGGDAVRGRVSLWLLRLDEAGTRVTRTEAEGRERHECPQQASGL